MRPRIIFYISSLLDNGFKVIKDLKQHIELPKLDRFDL
jgi:hypothetical protein